MTAISETVPSDDDDVEENVTAGTLGNQGGAGKITVGRLSGTNYYWIGTRFTSIGPALGDTIDDANLRFGVQFQGNEHGTERLRLHTAVGATGSDAFGASSRPTQRTLSTAYTEINPATLTAGTNREIDVTTALQEWVDAAEYDGDVCFIWKPEVMGTYDGVDISDTGATWNAVAPTPLVLEGNYSAGSSPVSQVMTAAAEHTEAVAQTETGEAEHTEAVAPALTGNAEHLAVLSQAEIGSAEHLGVVSQLETIAAEHLLTEEFLWTLPAEHLAAPQSAKTTPA